MITAYVALAELGVRVLGKVVELASEWREKMKEKITVTSSGVYVPGDAPVGRYLNGRFPNIPGTYRVTVFGEERVLRVTLRWSPDMRPLWGSQELPDGQLCDLIPDSKALYWMELLEPTRS